MSLHRLKAELGAAEFAPHAQALGPALDLTTALPPAAAVFLASTWPKGPTGFDMLLAEPWDVEAMEDYRELGAEDRMAVLASVGFLNHELVHRVDLLSTPFGVSFHGKACLETIGLLLEGAELIAALERREPWRPLRDIPPVAEKLVVSDGMDTLNARVRWFDALRGAAPKHLQPGWMSDPGVLRLAGVDLDRVMVHELMPTVLVPGADDAYLRPLTVLESRAVALTGLLLMNRLGGDDYAATEVARFLETFYTPREAFPDYRFLLDLFLRLWARDDLLGLATERGAVGLTGLLKAVSVVGWYGLHATPETNSEAPLNASPMLRVVIAMQELISYLGDGNTVLEAAAFLDAVDRGDRAGALGLTASRETLAYSLHYVRGIRRHNQAANPHPHLLAHFDRILALQEGQIERRLAHGYEFAAGLPEDGSVLGGLAAPECDEELFFDEEPPPEAVRRWFALRENLLFREARPPDFWPELWSAVGTHPGAGELSPAAARELALSRARFVGDGGIWPTYSAMGESEEEGRALFVPVRRSALPRTFDAGEGLTVETEWSAIGLRGEALAALRIGFAETEEEVRLLFSLERHRGMVEALIECERLVLVTEEAFAAVQRGEAHPEMISCPVTASAEVLETAREAATATARLTRYEHGWSVELEGEGSAPIDWAVEAYGWREPAEAALFLAELKSKPLEDALVVGLPSLPESGFAVVLTAIGPSTSVRRFREERIAGTGGEVHLLSEAEARDLASAGLLDAINELRSRGLGSVSFTDLKPRDVRLD